MIPRRLFLSGMIGCGKSTVIRAALGDRFGQAAGFVTVRMFDEEGNVNGYQLCRPDGSDGQRILDYSEKPYRMFLQPFETLGVQLLREAEQAPFVLLDEIGGFEVLSTPFVAALERLLQSDRPIIGVMKAASNGGKLVQRLGLGEQFVENAERLRRLLQEDEDTLLYDCGQFDPKAAQLAGEWVARWTGGELS